MSAAGEIGFVRYASKPASIPRVTWSGMADELSATMRIGGRAGAAAEIRSSGRAFDCDPTRRVINESAARALYIEGQEQFDEHKMERVARDYFQTSWGNDALAWLGEWPGGVCFCDLSEARSLDGVHFAVAMALGVPLGRGSRACNWVTRSPRAGVAW